jgi:hypothetical protein
MGHMEEGKNELKMKTGIKRIQKRNKLVDAAVLCGAAS